MPRLARLTFLALAACICLVGTAQGKTTSTSASAATHHMSRTRTTRSERTTKRHAKHKRASKRPSIRPRKRKTTKRKAPPRRSKNPILGVATAVNPSPSSAPASASPAPAASVTTQALAPVLSSTGTQVAGVSSVPSTADAVDTSTPTHVIGNGTPTSCTSADVVQDVALGGIITFNCGPLPLTITLTQTAEVTKTSPLVVLDGGGLITLSGDNQRRIIESDTCSGTLSTDDCVNQPYPDIVVQNLTLEDGFNGSQQPMTCTQNIPACWYGGDDGGGAIYVEGGQFKAVNTTFVDNNCYAYGPDLGGGAIRALAQYENNPVYITNDTFEDNSCSNGGALSSISVQWDVSNSSFIDNSAIGWGSNPAAAGTLGGGNGGAIYLDGENDNALIASTVLQGNTAREGGGAVFDVVDGGYGSLTFDLSDLESNVSGEFETFPGVYYQLDGHDLSPTMTGSVASSTG
jgi:hypothetical protein